MPRPRGSTNPSLQELSSSQSQSGYRTLAADAPPVRSHSSSIPAMGTIGGDLLQDSEGQDRNQQTQQQHFSSAFARAKALALEKTNKLLENSAILSEMAKEKGANWKAKAKAIHGSELGHHIWKGGKGRREKDQERSGGSAESYDSAITSSPGGTADTRRTLAGGGEKRKFGGRSELEYSGGSTAVFGVPLKLAVEASRIDNVTSLPRVVVRCIEYLDAKGLNEVGIYRIPGSTTTVSKLRAAFDSGSDINFEKTYEDPNAVATLLKMFLRDLPEPVLTADLDPVFNGCLSDYDHELSATDPEYEHLISRRLAAVATHLPDENYELLAWLMCHLARVDYFSDVNKMNCSNLGLIFCPTLGISSVMFRYFVGCCEDMFPLPRREPAGGEVAWGTPHYSGEEVVDTCEVAAKGDSPQTADDVLEDVDPDDHSPEAGPVSLAEGKRRSGDESELRQRAEKRQNRNSVTGDLRADGAHASTSPATDEINNAETRMAHRRPEPTTVVPGRRMSSMPAESHKTSFPNSTAHKPSTSPPPPPASPRRNQVRVVRSSFSMGDLIALSNSLDALDGAVAGRHTDSAGDVRQGIPAQGRTSLLNGPGVPDSSFASSSTPSSKASRHALHAPSPLESAAAQQYRSLEPVPQSPAVAEPDVSIPSSSESPRSLLAQERLQPSRQTSQLSPSRHEQRNPPSAVGDADPDPVKSSGSESPESADRPESGSILGLTGSDGKRVRTSDQLFEYFFAEAERRIQEGEATAGNRADGEAAPAAASARGGGGAVNLMD